MDAGLDAVAALNLDASNTEARLAFLERSERAEHDLARWATYFRPEPLQGLAANRAAGHTCSGDTMADTSPLGGSSART
jgi:hypothetical protein